MGPAASHRPQLAAGEVLDSMAGAVYLTDLGGTILACNAGWDRFAGENRAAEVQAERVLGRPMFGGMAGEARGVFEDLHRAVATGRRREIGFAFRCDAPELRRDMWLALTPLVRRGAIAGVLYQALLLGSEPRPPMRIFGAPDPEGPWLTLCSNCKAVRWPPGSEPGAGEWVTPEEYYRRGGPGGVQPSHGLCPACRARFRAVLGGPGGPAAAGAGKPGGAGALRGAEPAPPS